MIYHQYLGVVKQKSKLLLLTVAALFGLSVVVGMFGAASAATTYAPSTNDINRTNGWAHFNATPAVGEVDFEFVQPRNFYSCFEYRTDGDTSQVVDEEHFLEFYGVVEESVGLQQYPQYCLSSVGTQTETIEANEFIEIRMIVGAEGDERFDWTRVDLAEAVDVDVYGDTSAGYGQNGWLFNRDTNTATEYKFNSDAASIGDGSIYVLPIDGSLNGDDDKFIGEYFTGNEPVSEFNSLSYDFQVAGDGDSSDANEFYTNLHANFPGNENNYGDCKFDYVPDVATTGSFTTFSFDAETTPDRVRGTGCPATLADMPEGSTIFFFALNVGDTSANDTNLAGYYDNVVLATNNAVTTFDFEPVGQVEGLTIVQDGENLGCYPVINNRNILVDWDDVAGSVEYNYQADADKTAPFDFTTQVSDSERAGAIRDLDGTYNYRVQAVNSNGDTGEWSEWCGVTLDREAPTVELTNPEVGDVLSGEVDITGSVEDDNLLRYRLVVRDLSDNSFVVNDIVTTDVSPVSISELWDTTEVEDGEYRVALNATDQAGNFNIVRADVTVDNRPDNKDECKKGGWELGLTLDREFRNQGDCVSHFASDNQRENNPDGNRNANGRGR